MERLSRSLLRDRVYESILGAIVRGELWPGDRIVEYKIARELAVSQAPVREAIQRLSAEGIITTQNHAGSFVRSLRREDLQDVFDIREMLESIAAGRAAALRLDDHQLAKLEGLLKEMRAVGKSGDLSNFVSLDMAFHAEVVRLSGSAALAEAVRPLLAQIGAFAGSKNLIYFQDPQETARAHQPILDALRSGDPARAKEEVHRHVRRAWEGTLVADVSEKSRPRRRADTSGSAERAPRRGMKQLVTAGRMKHKQKEG